MPEPANIVLVNHVSWVGGAEHSLLDLAAALDRTRFRLRAAVPRGGTLGGHLRTLGVEVAELPLRPLARSWRPGRLLPGLAGVALGVPLLRRCLRRWGADVIHANSNTAHLYAALAAPAGQPVLWHSRDLRPLGRLGPWLYRHAAAVVANSEAVRDHLAQACGSAGRIRVVYNGIDTDHFAPGRYSRAMARTFLGFPADALVVILVAHLVPWKRHDLFLEAARLVAAEDPTARFLVVGGDLAGTAATYRRRLEAVAAAPPLAGRVVFTGAVEDVGPLLEAADVLVHTADAEPFGRALVEALAMERPVVAPAAGGAREIVRRGMDGFLVRPGDPHAFAAAVLRLAGDPGLRHRFGTTGRRRAVESFSRTRLVAELGVLYEELLAQRRPDGADRA